MMVVVLKLNKLINLFTMEKLIFTNESNSRQGESSADDKTMMTCHCCHTTTHQFVDNQEELIILQHRTILSLFKGIGTYYYKCIYFGIQENKRVMANKKKNEIKHKIIFVILSVIITSLRRNHYTLPHLSMLIDSSHFLYSIPIH